MSRLRIVVLVALASLVASIASAQQASITGIAMDESKAVLPGVNVTATDQAAGRILTAVTNEKGQYLLQNMPPGKYTVQAELSGFLERDVQGRRAAGRAERDDPVHPEARLGHRNADRHRRDAAGRHHVLAGRRQRRPPPDGTAAAAGPQLDGAVEAGEGRYRQRRRQQHRHRRDGRPLAAQSRRPADHPEGGRLRLRTAEVQPRVDRRVPDRHQHVRHHPGAVGRHGDPGDLQVGHEQHDRQRLWLLPQRLAECGGPGAPTKCCPTRTSRSAARSAGRSSRTRSTTSARIEYEREPGTLFSNPSSLPTAELQHSVQERAAQLPGPRRRSAVAEQPPVDPRIALGLGEPGSAGGRRPPVGGVGSDQGRDQRARHLVAGDERRQQDPRDQGRLQRLPLDQRAAGLDAGHAGIPRPRSDVRRAVQLSADAEPEQLDRPRRLQPPQGQARPQDRRRVHPRAQRRPVVHPARRLLHLQQRAGQPGHGAAGGAGAESGGLEPGAAQLRSPATTRSTSPATRATGRSTCRVRPTPCGSATTGAPTPT